MLLVFIHLIDSGLNDGLLFIAKTVHTIKINIAKKNIIILL